MCVFPPRAMVGYIKEKGREESKVKKKGGRGREPCYPKKGYLVSAEEWKLGTTQENGRMKKRGSDG